MTDMDNSPDFDNEDSDFVIDGFESHRDWIGTNALEGVEGDMIIKVTCYGHTPEQQALMNSIIVEFGSEARELFQQLIDKHTK